MSFLSRVADQINLRWAWEKIRNASTPGDIWIDEVDLASFELELERNLLDLHKQLMKGSYRISAIRPMGFPKMPAKDGTQQTRQYFHFLIVDQVAWAAVANVLAPHIDGVMPAWSYGNRLFRSIWIDTDSDGRRVRRIGRYRHSSGRIYLPFQMSWPIFRRHVYLAIRAMSRAQEGDEPSQEDLDEMEFQRSLKQEHRCPFVFSEYWATRTTEKAEQLYWCSIDLAKFYPSMRLTNVHNNIVRRLPEEDRSAAAKLLKSMLRFPLDLQGWTAADLAKINIQKTQKWFTSIPTGLQVAGFLANAGLLTVDDRVEAKLAESRVAHFRYVDDHVFLAYNFEELVEWVDKYVELLESENTGAYVNPEKIEPMALSTFLIARKRKKAGSQGLTNDLEDAKAATRLDPKFPSPLMTKTLALVSRIGRTDFNLLEEDELAAMVNQLEHFLLVDIPETELPERTRLAFAATRLARLAEQRLANDTDVLRLESDLTRLEKINAPQVDISSVNALLQTARSKLERESLRVFGLLRKVLRDRPDRVRLWTRAIQLCRQVGVPGLQQLFSDIDQMRQAGGALSADYLLANSLALLGTNTILATRTLTDPEAAEWRRRAARKFLIDVCTNFVPRDATENLSWFVQYSWVQYSFGLFCAHYIAAGHDLQEDFPRIPPQILEEGVKSLSGSDATDRKPGLVWWAARMTLGDLKPTAERWVAVVGRMLPSSEKMHAFWRYFPLDIPLEVLAEMISQPAWANERSEGWWFDALLALDESAAEKLALAHPSALDNVAANLADRGKTDTVSLLDWCEFLESLASTQPSDPRAGEWTALEVTRQIAQLTDEAPVLDIAYVKRHGHGRLPRYCFHPANFRVPASWTSERPLTWEQWKQIARTDTLTKVADSECIQDARYAPITYGWFLSTINPIRGIGLVLCGLLRRTFQLPTAWNGPGHSDVLRSLPRILMQKITCSSHTLGVLQGCLQPRAAENLSLGMNLDFFLDDDRTHDPFSFTSVGQLTKVIVLCQKALDSAQLSTFNHQARQLTPISIRALTEPNWAHTFSLATDATQEVQE